MGFFDKFSDKLLVIAEKVDDNKYLGAIKNAFTQFLPFVVIGSFANLFTNLICSTDVGLAKFIPILANLKGGFNAINYGTIGFISIYVCFFIGLQMAKRNKTPEVVTGALCVASFVSVVPNVVSVTFEEVTQTGAGLASTVTGAQGLFIAMILSLIVCELFYALNKVEKIKIRMPKEVPSGIATGFNILIPAFIVILIVMIFGAVFQMTTGSYLNEWIYAVVQTPLQTIFQSPGGIIVLIILMQLFWFLGIHGGLVLFPIRQPLVIAALATNMALVEQGLAPTEAITDTFWIAFTVFGGGGCAMALLLDLLIFGKRKEEKEIAKVSLIPGIFGISEPMVFGIPIVLNPTYFLPFVLGSALTTGIALGAVSIGFLTPSIVSVPVGLPPIITAFLGFGMQGVIVQLVALAAAMVLYAPFVKMSNRQAARLQKEEANA